MDSAAQAPPPHRARLASRSPSDLLCPEWAQNGNTSKGWLLGPPRVLCPSVPTASLPEVRRVVISPLYR